MNRPDDHKLERVIHQTLRELPSLQAPRTLEMRVMAEIARRVALPWWRQSYRQWPVPARVALAVALFGSVKLALTAGMWIMAGFDASQIQHSLSAQFGWVEATVAVVRALGDFVGATLRNLPPLWLYGALAVVGGLYATLFGLGAAAYRALYTHR